MGRERELWDPRDRLSQPQDAMRHSTYPRYILAHPATEAGDELDGWIPAGKVGDALRLTYFGCCRAILPGARVQRIQPLTYRPSGTTLLRKVVTAP